MTVRLVVLGCLLATASACGAGTGDDERGVLGRPATLDATTWSLVLPGGTLRLDVGDPQDTVAATEAADGRAHPAPDGARWIGLDWSLAPDDGVDGLQHALMADPEERTTLELVSGDARTDLGDAPGSTATPAEVRTGGTVYVVVPAGEAPTVEVSLDGLTARVDLQTGATSGDLVTAMAGLVAPVSAACPPLTGRDVTADVACNWTVTTVPYLAGRGWSESGGWTVAQVETRVDAFTRGGTTYAVREARDDSSFDGSQGAASVVDERLTSLVTRLAVDGSPDRLRIGRTLVGLRDDGPGPEDATVELATEVALPRPSLP